MPGDVKDYNYEEEPKYFPFIKEDITDEGFFSGYGSTFGGKPDSYGDLIKYGAFTETILKGGKFGLGVKVLAEHRNTVGIYHELSQNQKGLKVRGQIEITTTIGGDTHKLMKMGAINALSIGWEPLREDSKGKRISLEEAIDFDDKLNQRLLKLIDLWEISPVTFPANNRALITDVKDAIEKAKDVRQLEYALRDAGLSRNAAKYVAGLCKHSLKNERSYYGDDLRVMLGSLKRTSSDLAIGGILEGLKGISIPSVQREAVAQDDKNNTKGE